MQAPSPLDQREQLGRLQIFLRWLKAIAAFFGSLELIAGAVYDDPQSIGAGIAIWVYLGVTVVASRLLLHGRLSEAALLTSIGIMLTAVVIATVQPAVYPGLVEVALIAVAIALPYIHGRALVASLAIAWLGAIVIVALGLMRPVPTVLPDAYLAGFNIAAVAATTGLVLILLWQFGDHLTSAVVQARTATDELRRAEAKRLEAAQRLAMRERHASLGLLAGGIAHDFNNLLTAILGHTELLAADLPSTTSLAARDSLIAIGTAAQRAADLSRQMLTYSGRSVVTLRSIDLDAFVADLATELRANVPDLVRLEVVIDGTPGRIDADARQLRQAIENVVDNAVEALAKASIDHVAQGAISVHVREVEWFEEDTRAPIAPDPLAPGRYVAFEIADDGPGIPPTLGARIFEPFVTTGFVGRGLGLSVTLGIARSHGGTVTVSPAAGGGTVVTLLIPLAV